MLYVIAASSCPHRHIDRGSSGSAANCSTTAPTRARGDVPPQDSPVALTLRGHAHQVSSVPTP